MAFKKVILKISLGFVIFLFILTFFSRTISDMNIPSIAIIGSTTSELIQYTTTLNGTVDYSEKKLVYSPVKGNIELLVKKGERIINGQPLFMVKSDLITQMEMLSDLEHEKEWITSRLEQAINDKTVSDNKLTQLKEALEQNEEQSQKILSAIDTGGSYIITAELDETEGIISDIKFNINNSNYIHKDNIVLEIGIVNDIYIAEIMTPGISKNIKIGTQAKIVLSETVCNGIVENITSENGLNIITVQFKSEIIAAGQTASVVIGEPSKLFDFVLPNSAVRKDAGNIHFIYMVEARKGQFGYDYFVVKIKVDIIDQDEKNTALVSFYPNKNIIVGSDMPIYEGSRVKIMNGSDFDAIR